MSSISLSDDDRALLTEYEKIVQFHSQVLAGTHPRVSITERVVHDEEGAEATETEDHVSQGGGDLQENQLEDATLRKNETSTESSASSKRYDLSHRPFYPPRATKGTFQGIEIDYKHNYYKDLGLKKEDRLTTESIKSGYKHKTEVYAPGTEKAKEWLKEGSAHDREKYNKMWLNLHKAYRILSDRVLRRHYDEYYIEPDDEEKAKLAVRRAKIVEAIQQKYGTRHGKSKRRSAIKQEEEQLHLASRMSRVGQTRGKPTKKDKPRSSKKGIKVEENPRPLSFAPTAPRAMISSARPLFRGSAYPQKIDKVPSIGDDL